MHEGLVESLIIISLLIIGSMIATYLLEDSIFLSNRMDEVKARLIFCGFLDSLAKLGAKYLETSFLTSNEPTLNLSIIYYNPDNAITVCLKGDKLLLSVNENTMSLDRVQVNKVLGFNLTGIVVNSKNNCISSSMLEIRILRNSSGLYLFISSYQNYRWNGFSR